MIESLKRVPRALISLASNRMIARDIAGAFARGAIGDMARIARTAGRAPDLYAEKVVSHNYRFIWMCVPKAGSRSILAALRNLDPEAEILHMRSRDICAVRPGVKDYYSFAFLRCPFARTLSWYQDVFLSAKVYADEYHLYRDKKERTFFDAVAGRSVSMGAPLCELAEPFRRGRKRRWFFDEFYGLRETSSFEDACGWLGTPYGSDAFGERHFLSQHTQIRLADGRLPDFVGRFENLDADMNRVAAHLGAGVAAVAYDGGLANDTGSAEGGPISGGKRSPDGPGQGIDPNPVRRRLQAVGAGGLARDRIFWMKRCRLPVLAKNSSWAAMIKPRKSGM